MTFERKKAANEPAACAGAVTTEAFTLEAFGVRFREAEQRLGTIVRRYRMARRIVQVHYAGQILLERLSPAIEHLETSGGEPADLDIYTWQSADSGIGLPAVEWFDADDPPREDIRTGSDAPLFVCYQAAPGSLSLLERSRGEAFYWCGDSAAFPFYERAAPFRLILHRWFMDRGIISVHGGCVGRDSCGVVIAGKGGKGKSTISLLCLLEGMRYVGDDYFLLSAADDGFVGHSIYANGKLKLEQLERIPALAGMITDYASTDDEKITLAMHRQFRDRFVAELPIGAIVIPEISGRADTHFRRANAAQAMLAVMPSTMLQLPGYRAEEFESLSRLVRNVSAYSLTVGTDLTQIPKAVAAIIAEVHP